MKNQSLFIIPSQLYSRHALVFNRLYTFRSSMCATAVIYRGDSITGRGTVWQIFLLKLIIVQLKSPLRLYQTVAVTTQLHFAIAFVNIGEIGQPVLLCKHYLRFNWTLLTQLKAYLPLQTYRSYRAVFAQDQTDNPSLYLRLSAVANCTRHEGLVLT